ncbi:putative non-ribosomal peptide synthetase [Nemania sp. NC0429]|nr:putative non-ribosomal peptide synthetase [Nemania sp. NC0429]
MSLNQSIPLHAEGLSILNARPRRLPGPHFLHQLVSLASRDGQSAAIDFLSENDQHTVISYSELHAASLALARRISCILDSASSPSTSATSAASEARSPLIIPILAPQCPQLYVAILAVLQAGGAFCPLNADAPPNRVRFILDDVKTKVVLVNRHLASKLQTDDKTYSTIFIDDVLDIPTTNDHEVHCKHVLDPEDLAYVMYTSGSTGEPKGVAVSHSAATQSILAHERHIPSFSRFLQFAAPTFDVSIFEIFFPLFRGATLVGCNRAEMLTDLVGVMKRMEVDACELTPSVAGSLLRQRSRAPCLRLLLTIGEMLTEPVIREFGGDENENSILWGMYGPTEVAIHCTVEVAFAVTSEKGKIGIPFDTVSAFVIRLPTDTRVASQFEVLPVGEVGELALGGFQLASYYLNRTQQTTTSFINTPWGRVYKTGDKAKIRPDGTIEFLGRVDENQVKLNGQRLELGEVEQVLLRTSGCHSAVAAVVSNALVVFAATEPLSDVASQLWAQCRSWLPAFMVPTDIIVMKQLPQLPSGKIDKKRLINDYINRTTMTTGNQEILDDYERLLCEVATSVLSEQVGPLTEFSVVRLDSLVAIEYASSLRENGLSVAPIDILSTKTPRELRRRLGDVGALAINPDSEHQSMDYQLFHPYLDQSRFQPALRDQVDEIERIEAPTPLQQSMIAETFKDTHLYISQVELELVSPVTLDVLHSSLRRLAECNEILRSGFAFVESRLCQVIWKRLSDSQFYDSVEGINPVDEVEDTELFLLRPLRIEIREPSSEENHVALLLTLHHAIYDGWTVDLMIEDLSLLLSGGLPLKRPQFSEVSRYLHRSEQAINTESMEFWAEHLRGVGAVTTSRYMTVVDAQPRRAATFTKISLHPTALQNLMSRVSMGPQVLFQACLVWLWTAVQGSPDTVIGCVSSGRSLPLAGIDKLMGPCMATLPLRINISKYRTVIEVLQSIHSINRETLKHGHIPLSEINKVAGLSTSSKLFDVIFVYQESPASRRNGSNAVRETWHRDATEAKLVVEIRPNGDHFVCQTTYHTRDLPESLAEAFSSNLGYLAEYFASYLDAALETIPQCFPHSNLSHFNENPRSLETDFSLLELVENSASRFPSAPALHFAKSISPSVVDSQLSYHDLNARANQIARYLQQCDLDSGDVIAVVMEKSPLLYCSILGVLKIGCAYLPILPSTPLERVNVIFDQAKPRLCVVNTASSNLFSSRKSPKIINIEASVLSSYSDTNLGTHSSPSDLAYVIYTSGTTGTPKGVAVTNKNITSNLNVLSGIYPHDQSKRMLQACSQAFDVSVFEIFFAWANGMCLCAATNDTLFEDFEHAVRVLEITHLSLTVTVASLLNPEKVPTVKFLVTSGEPMTDEVLDRWSQHLYQGYGPSETTNICTVRKVYQGDSPQFLGWSLENTSTFVLDPSSTHLVPVGCIGELCFGGDQVASGYLNLPGETNARFIDHPSYGRLYRSGDLGRMLPDGSLIIHGRIDTQVKLRGLRIELQEIQEIALKTGLARTCKTVLVTDTNANVQQLALFYSPFGHESSKFHLLPLTGASDEQIRTLRHTLQSCLPDYMVPNFIIPISALPLTSSGKVDEGKLRSSVTELSTSALDAYSSAEDQTDLHSDWSTTETLIANAIIDLWKKDNYDISRWATFSALGIDSISAMPLVRKLQSILQKRVPLSLLLQNPTVNRLASAIDQLKSSEESIGSNNPLLPRDLVETIRKRLTSNGQPFAKVLPCTPLQEAMVMSSLNSSPTIANNSVAYYNQMLFRLYVPYERIISLWNEVIRRHEILRAIFITSDNIRYPAVQIILDSYIPDWQVLETDDASLIETASQHVTYAPAITDRDKPPLALAIIRTKESGDYLSFVCHHAMYDGISMRIMLSEIEALYHGRHLSEPPSFEPFLREILLPDPNQDSFWKQLFLDFERIPLSCKQLEQDKMPRSMTVKASVTSLRLIKSQLQEMGVSMLALIQTSWAITIFMLSARRDVAFGNVVAGRSIPSDMVGDLVAPCFNTLPIRMKLSASTFLIDIMKDLQGLNSKVMKYQFTSLRRIQKATDTTTRLFDSLVILQPPATPLDDTLWSLIYEDGHMDMPVVCEVTPSDLLDELTIQLHRDKSKISHQALQLISSIFSHVLDICLKYPSSHIPTSKSLPNDLGKEIQRLFHRPGTSQHSSDYPTQASDTEETWSPLELTIRQTLAKLAGIQEDHIKRLTPIYRYGLDSITAIQLASLLRQQNVLISAIDLIGHPTCAGIAASVNNSKEENVFEGYDFDNFQRQVEGELLEYDTDLTTVEAILPCTATQQALLSKFLDSKGRHYFNYSSWEFNMDASIKTIAGAWSQLTNHLQILRTGFVSINHPDSTFAMLVYHVNHFTAPIAIYQWDQFDVDKWISDATAEVLDAVTQPPWRLAIVAPETTDVDASPTMHLAIHHALYDAFTLRSLLQYLCELISHGNRPKVASLNHSISHYFDLVQSSQQAGESYWKQKAGDFVSHKFPVMTPLHVKGFEIITASRTCEISTALLRQVASDAGVMVQAALQAAWTRLLSSYIGESRVTFGVVFDGRTTDLARNMTLPMITTLPVIAENVPSNSGLIQQMMQYNSQLRRFQFMPISHVQRLLGTTGPMFDTILLYQAVNKSMKQLPLRVVKELASVEYAISLEVEETSSNTTQLNLAFRADILPLEQAMLMLGQFEAVLIDLLFPAEDSHFRHPLNKPNLFSILPPSCESLPIETQLLHELLEHSAQLTPSVVALEFVEKITHFDQCRKWTYRELDSLGNQVAHLITRQGVGPGNIIATCFNKCPIAYFTLLGILKAGCTFLCLDPSAPATRQKFILDDSHAAMLIMCESFDWAHEASLPVHIVNESMLAILPTSRPLLRRQILPSDSCYCLYTSGTTGTPKGCLISHENATQAMAAFNYLFTGRWNPKSRWLQFAAFHFDVSVLEQYWSWYVGITVVAAPKDLILSDIALTISKLGITHIDLTPSLARLISPDECPSLCEGIFITGGEKLRSDVLETWGSTGVIHNAYGPTEATIGITMYRGVPQNGRPSNIGNLFPNVGAYIIESDSGIPVLRGGVGELCVSGKLVGQGYLNREALTKERFLVLQASGQRVYRTGDLVRVLHDNSLDFLGRADDQVKLRGQRLEIGEINHTIRAGLSDRVSDVVTMVTKRRAHDVDLLVSFITLSSDSGSASDLQIYADQDHIEIARRAQEICKSRLATYMVPSFIICVSRIPLSTNNKVEIKLLKQLFSELSQEKLQILSTFSLQTRQTLNKPEAEVLEAISQVVHVQETDITPSTTIFQLGIDSITATRLAKQLRTIGFTSATPSIILRHPQIDQLSQALRRPNIGTTGSNQALQIKHSIKAMHHRYLSHVCKALDVTAAEVEYIAPCTPLQQGIIARSNSREFQLAYFNQFKLHLRPNISVHRLKVAISRVIACYSILRTAFIDTPDGFLQVAIKSRPLRWFEVESRTGSSEQFITERQRHWMEENLDTLQWPIEVDHVKLDGQHYLLLRLFHGVYDARSLDIIVDCLEAEYEGISWPIGPAFISVLPEGPFISHPGSHRFWKSLLRNHRFQSMPSLIDKPVATDSLIDQSAKFDGLETKRRNLQVTHQTLLQAAWLYTLRQYFVEPPTIGVILSGRSLAIDDVDLVVGPLFNTLPLRIDFTDDMSWESMAHEIQKHSNGLLAFVHTPLRDIQKVCANGRPLFDTLFSFDRDYNSGNKSKRTLWSIQDSPPHPDYPLAIEIIMMDDDTLRITLAAQGNIADKPALNSLLSQFTESLNSIIALDNHAPLSFVGRMVHPEIDNQDSMQVTESNPSTNNIAFKPQITFSWDETSYDLRRELAAIAKVDETEISETTNLFALGLDSIDVIKLVGRLKKMGYDVSIGALMKQPTFDSITINLEKSPPLTTNTSRTTDLDNVVRTLEDYCRKTGFDLSDVEAVLPPTPLQDSMVAEMLRSDFHTYFNHDVLELPSGTDIDRLKLALSTVYAGSPILRTVFLEVDDPQINSAYCQVVRKHKLEISPVMKISNAGGITVLTDRVRLLASESSGASSLFQVHFAELENKNLMVLSIAHALYDGWSLHMLYTDIQVAYESNYVPRPFYSSYLSHMLFRLTSPSQKFWANLLNGSQATLIQKASTTPKLDTIHRLDKQSRRSVAEIRELCKDIRVTPQVLSQACWAAVLASLTKSLDVVFGVVMSGRDTEEAQGLMFPTMNTVPLRLALHGTVTEFLEYAQDIMSNVIEFQHTPLRDVQRLTRGHGDGLFNTIFLLQNSRDTHTGSSSFFKSTHSVSAVDYPLCAELELDGNDAFWRIACDSNYMNPQDVESLGASLETVLDYYARDVNKQVLIFDSRGSQTVSICGLEPVTFKPELQEQDNGSLAIEDTSQHAISSPRRYDILLSVLSDLSKIEQQEIDPRLSIFHIGLDSISAIKASSMLRKRGLEISTKDLVTIPSILGIFEHANRAVSDEPEGPTENSLPLSSVIGENEIRTLIQQSGLNEDSIATILPALPVQGYMLSVWQNSGGAIFFPKFTFKLSSPINLMTVSKAWASLVDEIVMLRTRFISTSSLNTPFLQVVLKPKFASKHAMSIATESESRWEFIYAATPFAVAQFIGDQSREACLHLSIHHALYDGISLPIILDRFTRLCNSPTLLTVLSRRAPWHEFSLKHIASTIRDQRESFWTSYLSGNPAIQSHQPNETQTPNRDERTSEFRHTAITNLTGLKARGSMHGISTQALLYAAYARAFLKGHHRDRHPVDETCCIFGVYLANRSGYPAIEEAPFPTLNILPLCRWTGVAIDTFVNILSQPDGAPPAGANPVTLEKIAGHDSSFRQGTDISTYLAVPNSESLSPNAAAQYCPEGIDIELALREGALDIGVFGPSRALSAAQANDMIATLVTEIEAL